MGEVEAGREMNRHSINIAELIRDCEIINSTGSLQREVTGLFWDSRQPIKGGVFFALGGDAVDGHRYVSAAIDGGAAVVVLETLMEVPEGVTCIKVASSRLAMALMARAWYANPTAGIPVVAITGTNGKTTTSFLVESVLRQAGYRPCVLGTVSYRFEDHILPASHTTPESVTLYETISKFRDMGCNAVVMEVSSHALAQYRTGGIVFAAAVFTNLTPEHLDYHDGMEDYYASKKLLFSQLASSNCGIANIDDPYGRRLISEIPALVSCGTDSSATIHIEIEAIDLDGVKGTLVVRENRVPIHSALLGRFNVENIICTAAVGTVLGIDLTTIAKGIDTAPQVPGRLEKIENDLGASILVDYAHSPDALDKALSTLSALKPTRLISIVGCGGDRDKTKRPVMAEISCKIADITIITSDNPRTEDPQSIIDDMIVGARKVYPEESSVSLLSEQVGKGALIVSDRRQAIQTAIASLRSGDLLLIAGKGHEDYQIIGTTKFPFDDRKIARESLLEVASL